MSAGSNSEWLGSVLPEALSPPQHRREPPTTMVVQRIEGVGRTTRREFVGPRDLADYIAGMGPVVTPDLARGFIDPMDPGAMLLPLQDGSVALIDTDDYPLVRSHHWMLNNAGYAYASHRYVGVNHYLLLHRVIAMLPTGSRQIVDHRNHYRADCRKENLRPCTAAQNAQNARLSKRNTTGHKGVFRNRNTFGGYVEAFGERRVAYFQTLEEAASWTRATRDLLHGDFACHGDGHALRREVPHYEQHVRDLTVIERCEQQVLEQAGDPCDMSRDARRDMGA